MPMERSVCGLVELLGPFEVDFGAAVLGVPVPETATMGRLTEVSVALAPGGDSEPTVAIRCTAGPWQLAPEPHRSVDVPHDDHLETLCRLEAPQQQGAFFAARLPVAEAPFVAWTVGVMVA